MTDTVDITPSIRRSAATSIAVASSVPSDATAVGLLISLEGELPGVLGVDRATLAALGFAGKVGQAYALPAASGTVRVVVGVGDSAKLDASVLRDAAAAFARAAGQHSRLALLVPTIPSLGADVVGQVVVEGVILARYRFDALRADKGTSLDAFTLVVGADRAADARTGIARGRLFADAQSLARDLASAPAVYLTAPRMAEVATQVAAASGLEVEVFDRAALKELGCGGLLGVNAGSAEEPRMIRLTYRPSAAESGSHLGLVGKGIMYDSGGVSIKPSNASHSQMKNDMSGAGAILAAMSTLAALDCPNTVTGWLMCTDNMLQGSAMKLGDVLTMRGGMTVEVINTDAEGRLVMADGLVLAAELGVDAIVDIATLTGACLAALGPKLAGVFGNDQALVDQVSAAGRATDELVWQLPLDRRYRPILDSQIADIKNWEEGFPGATTAALFLEEFVAGKPWVHIDIAGTAQNAAAESWRPAGVTGFGARLLIEFALDFSPTVSVAG